MATVTGFTSARMLQIEQNCIVNGAVDLNGRLQLTTRGGTQINAGLVKGDKGDQGEEGPPGTNGTNGLDANYIPTAIGSNVNLNTLVTAGFYTQQLTAQATVALNYPSNIAGLLEVSHNPSQTMVYQRYTSYLTNAIWVRSRYQNVWNEWSIVFLQDVWTPLTFASGYGSFETYTCQWKQIGSEIQFRGLMARTAGTWAAGTAYTNVLTLPAAIRPSASYFGTGASTTNQSNAVVVIGTSGALAVRTGTTVASYVSLDNIRYSLI